jgi:hypothetical protein
MGFMIEDTKCPEEKISLKEVNQEFLLSGQVLV